MAEQTTATLYKATGAERIRGVLSLAEVLVDNAKKDLELARIRRT